MSKHDEDEPLEPAVEAIRVKMVRLLAVSGGIMVLGLMTVLGAIVYKINQPAPAVVSAAKPAEENILLIPTGATVANTAISRDGITLTLTMPDGSTRVQFHRPSGERAAVYTISEE